MSVKITPVVIKEVEISGWNDSLTKHSLNVKEDASRATIVMTNTINISHLM